MVTKMDGNYLAYSIFTEKKRLTCLSVLQKENIGRAISLLIYGNCYLPFLQLWLLLRRGGILEIECFKKNASPIYHDTKLKAKYTRTSSSCLALSPA